MRVQISLVVLLLMLALGVCAAVSRRSRRVIAPHVAALTGSLILPVAGNLIIIVSSGKALSTVGSYTYFLGMNVVMFALLRFTMAYCRLSWPRGWLRTAVYLLLIVDAVQLLCNPVFHHAFDTEAVMVDGRAYYRLIPFAGQTFHRVVDYGIFLAVVVIFFVKMVRSPRIYFERYSVIFFSMVFIGLWETFYIFSRSPIDRSMIGFGVFGLLVFYFALYYRPVRLLDRMLAGIASEMPVALFFFDAIGRCVWANEPGAELAGLDGSDFEQSVDRLTRIFGSIDFQGGEWSSRRVLGVDADARYYALEKQSVTDAQDRVVGSFLSIRDETDQQRELMREKYNATHDRLTGLYTREYLYERVRETIRDNPDVTYMVAYLDVSDFKMVNDIFGSAFGDYTLKRIADSLRAHLPAGCLYGRLAGDTFGICIARSDFDPELAEQILDRFVVDNESVKHKLVIHQGIYEVSEPELDVSVMFDRAHMALETIKAEYKRHIAFYDDKMREKVLWDQHITSELGDAIAKRQICPYLQAMVDSSGRVVGAEALVRWIHPTDGFLSPDRFVPVFEKNGMIADVDRYMWRCACETLARWAQEGHGDLFISINVSPMDFYFMDVVAELKGIVGAYGVAPSRLRVEITETVMMTDNENRIQILNALKEAGFLVEMDDFGSGYSSLNMLKDMPVDVIKIDMMFLNQTKNDSRAQTILHNIMHLTGDLGISSLTEGVETEAQYRMLAAMGCKLFQGYYFARPMPVDQFETYCFSERR